MKVYFTTTGTGSLGTKAQQISYPISQVLNEKLGDYGDGLNEWFLMFVILSPETPGADAKERVMWKKKTKDLDMRLNVDFDAFKKGSAKEREALLLETMRRSLDIIAERDLPNFDAVALRSDFEKVAEAEGWSTADN